MDNAPVAHPPWRLSLQGWLSLFGMGFALWLAVPYLKTILEIGWVVFGAILFSLALRPLADRLQRWHVARGLTVLITYGVVVGLFVGVGYLLTPVINAEVSYLQANGLTLVQNALSHLGSIHWLPPADTLSQNIAQRLDSLVAGAINAVTSTGNLVLDLGVLFILAYFLTTEPGWGRRIFLRWFPPAQQAHVQNILDNTCRRLTRWMWAQATIILYFFVTFSIGLALLSVPFSLTISVIPVPYLGVAIATILTALDVTTRTPWLILWVLVYTASVSVIETHILLPVLYGRAVGLRAAVVLVALLAGARIGGIVGVFFAVPATVIFVTILQELQAVMGHETAVSLSPTPPPSTGKKERV